MTDRLPHEARDGTFVLRLWQPDDVELLHEAVMANLEHLRPWMAWIAHEPLTVEQRIALIAEWLSLWESGEASPMGMWADGRVVGSTGYVRRPGSAATEIGYWVHVDHLGRGYATRAARLLTTAAFESGQLGEIEIHHDKANIRSAMVPARLGFTPVGERPDEKAAPAEVGIDCTWRMTKREWQAAAHGTGEAGRI